MKVAVLGYGAIGKKRVDALWKLREKYNIKDILIYDPFVENLHIYNELESIERQSPEWVIVATPNDVAVDLVKKVSFWECSNILIEKPFGRNLKDATSMYLAYRGKHKLFVGHNYRFFDGVAKLVEDVRNNVFGNLINVNMILAHGGTPTDDKTWRLNSDKAGQGGSFLDLGTHLLDIAIQLINDDSNFYSYQGMTANSFWNKNLLEETHLLFCHGDCIFNLQTSMTRWQNQFRIEVNGSKGYGIVQGRGGHYGIQTYVRGKRWGWIDTKQKTQPEKLILTSDCSKSFYCELDAIFGNKSQYYLSPCTDNEALVVMTTYDSCLNAIQKRT